MPINTKAGQLIFKILSFLVLGFLSMLLIGSPCLAENNTAEKKPEKKMPEWIRPTDFSYNASTRIDPFKRFLQQEEPPPKQTKKKKKKPARLLTPLEKVQPSQLNLVGILWNQGENQEPLALVELPDGKGYILRVGTRVGRQKGRVVEISPSEVTILQQTKTILQETQTEKVVLKLHKSAGEGQ